MFYVSIEMSYFQGHIKDRMQDLWSTLVDRIFISAVLSVIIWVGYDWRALAGEFILSLI